MKKPRGEAILKNLPDALQEELWQYARRTTYPNALVWLKATHGVEVSEGTLSAFFSWYPRSLTLRSAAAMSSQLEETLKKMPALRITAEQAREVAAVNFELQAAQDRDPELFAALRKGELETARLKLEQDKHAWAKKSDIDRALDALFEEIAGDAIALELFEKFRARVKKLQEAREEKT